MNAVGFVMGWYPLLSELDIRGNEEQMVMRRMSSLCVILMCRMWAPKEKSQWVHSSGVSGQSISCFASHVTSRGDNVLGMQVAELSNARENAGSYSVTFEGGRLASGVYFYRLAAGNYTSTRKLILMK